jgi:4-aminobutyrate aminotransferase/(S)-3-amino-2-methylpropionate transaminase
MSLPSSKDLEKLLRQRSEFIPRGVFNMTPIIVSEARGARVRDVTGREYIDFAGGMGVLNVGHCPTAVVEAIRDQAGKYLHTCFHLAMYEPYIILAKMLNHIVPGGFPKKTLLANSGAEGVENAVKIARSFTGRPGIVAFDGGYHGRTLLALSLTGKVRPYKAGFGPFVSEVYRIPYAYCYRCPFGMEYPSCDLRCADNLQEVFRVHALPQEIAALVVEPVLGEGGIVVPPRGYLEKLQGICSEEGIVFVADEVQTGMGRTGKMFACQHFGVEPDIIIMGKSLAGGLPLSAVTGRGEVMDAPHAGGLGGTFSGNPLACRAAIEVVKILEGDGLPARALAIGKRVVERFRGFEEKYPIIGDIRCLGAMIGWELVRDRRTKEPATRETRQVVKSCYERGLLITRAGAFSNVLRALMPLVITDDEIDEGLSILEGVLREMRISTRGNGK